MPPGASRATDDPDSFKLLSAVRLSAFVGAAVALFNFLPLAAVLGLGCCGEGKVGDSFNES
jgi:hypothetical protein